MIRIFHAILHGMKTPRLQPYSNNGRKLTDESLKFERDKTDASLLEIRLSTEQHIDNGVSDERETADLSIEAIRKKSDEQLASARHAPGYNLEIEQRQADERLKKERARTDAAIEDEREIVDDATTRERDLKKTLESKLLSVERSKTDTNLSAERHENDSAIEIAIDSLRREKSGHSETKNSLTTRDEFIAIVSHDLKNPIGATVSCASMLLEDFEHTPEVRKWVEFMRRNSETSLRMIDDLLDVKRISENKMVMTQEPHFIAKVLRDACDTFTLAAANKRIELEFVPCDKNAQVNCDADRINQVIGNLISNAVKYTPSGGKICVRADVARQNLKVMVTDTGCGMTKDKLPTIFDRFAQLKSKDRSGLGLGLYISKNILEAHGSSLHVESQVDIGTSFSFSLPVMA